MFCFHIKLWRVAQLYLTRQSQSEPFKIKACSELAVWAGLVLVEVRKSVMRTTILQLVFSHLPKPGEKTSKMNNKAGGGANQRAVSQGAGPIRGQSQTGGGAKLGTGSVREPIRGEGKLGVDM